jgi:hypothetical protein
MTYVVIYVISPRTILHTFIPGEMWCSLGGYEGRIRDNTMGDKMTFVT